MIVDSSLWGNVWVDAASLNKDVSIKVGVVREVHLDQGTGGHKYTVEVQNNGAAFPVRCVPSYKFGGPFNYEEFSLRGYAYTKSRADVSKIENKYGDTVIVAFLDGDSREGVILCSVSHPARTSKLTSADEPAYYSEFNGLNTEINNKGEYILTFNGTPVNAKLAEKTASLSKVVKPVYNTIAAGSYFKFESDGSIHVNDKAIVKPQFIKIDKSGGKTTITSGQTTIELDKMADSIKSTTATYEVNASKIIKKTTDKFDLKAASKASLVSDKFYIGSETVELLDHLIKLIDALAFVQPISIVGPCTPLGITEQWYLVELIKEKIKSIKA